MKATLTKSVMEDLTLAMEAGVAAAKATALRVARESERMVDQRGAANATEKRGRDVLRLILTLGTS